MKPFVYATAIAAFALALVACQSPPVEPVATEELDETPAEPAAQPKAEIVAAEFEAWPFNVEGGELRCSQWNGQPAIVFYDAQSETAIPLNGVARDQFTVLYPELEDFDTAGLWNGSDLTEIIEYGLSLCS